MTDRFGVPPPTRPVWRRMVARDSGEAHRVATPLELFFDLCFVVAVAEVSAQLHHYLAEGQAPAANVPSYLAVFFAIWWAWMNFTWFASAYDIDDVPYRIAALVTITGALVLAAGVPRAFADHDFIIIAGGYTIMRLALISLWLRAARSDREGGRTARRYALGLAINQAFWIGWLFLPTAWQMPLFPLIALHDISVPPLAERTGRTAWHRRGGRRAPVRPGDLASATKEQASGADRVLVIPSRFGSGYMLPTEIDLMIGPNSFGHPGRGGSLGFADPEHGIAFGYVMNHIIEGDPNDRRAASLVDAVRQALA